MSRKVYLMLQVNLSLNHITKRDIKRDNDRYTGRELIYTN